MEVVKIISKSKMDISDKKTGEIIATDKEIVKTEHLVYDKGDTFFQSYSQIVGLYKNLNGSDIKVLTFCMVNINYNLNVITLNKFMINEISTTFNIKPQTIRNSISSLKKKNVLIPEGAGSYRMNPQYFWKGKSNDRKQNMKFILEMECVQSDKFVTKKVYK